MEEHVVGLRELRQNASDLVRRAEAGERITITVSGRAAAALSPIRERAWLHWSDVAEIFSTPVDAEWENDKDLIDNAPHDPWEPA